MRIKKEKPDRSAVSKVVGNAGLASWSITTIQQKFREVREFMKALRLCKGELRKFERFVFGARIALMKEMACCTPMVPGGGSRRA